MKIAVHDIRDTPQTFVEDELIAVSTGMERQTYPLIKHGAEPVLRQTEFYEGVYVGPVSVMRDEKCGGWRMWYTSGGEREIEIGTRRDDSLHLAVSSDGIHWEKEPLGIFNLPGGEPNNLCAFEDGRPVGGPRAIFEDIADPDPSKRFKMITYCPNYYLSYSADGICWRPAQDEPVWANGSGDGLEETSFFLRDPLLERYRGYMRVWRRHQTIRKTSLGESDDLLSWTGPAIIWEAQPHYGPGAQIYGMNVHVDAGMYWAFPWIFYTDEPADEALRMTMRLKFAYSRDGVEWRALSPELDAVAMGQPGAYDWGMMMTTCPPVLLETEGRLYYCGADGVHDGSDTHRAVGLATWTRGRFVGLEANGDGQLLTERFLFRGEALRINARTAPDGWVRAELLNDGGGVIKSYDASSFNVFTGDTVDHPLSWEGGSDLTSLFGQSLMLRLVLHKAEVFSFRAAGSQQRFEAPLGPPPVRCGRCTEAPAIDGVLDDPCWQDFTHSGVADDFVNFTDMSPAPTRTRALFTHDDENLYIAVECREPLTDRLPTAHDGDVVNYQKEDLVELRFTAPGHGTHVHQLMVTATGAKLHGWFSKEAGGSGLLECEDWQARVSVVPGLWCVEMAVPFTAITTPSPAADERWRINVIRYRYIEGREVSCWQCMYGSTHRTDLAGDMVFLA